MVDRDLDVTLSPELVLVSPDLRERALRNGSDTLPRWHVAPRADPPAPPPEPPPPPPEPPAVLRETPVLRQAPPAPLQAIAPLLDRPRAFWRASSVALSACVVFAGGVAVGRLVLPAPTARSVAPIRPTTIQRTTAPTFAESAPSRGVESAARQIEQPSTTALNRTPAPQAATRRPAVPSSQPQTPPGVAPPALVGPKPAATRAPTTKPVPAPVRAIPNGGYVLPDGHFRVTGDARTIIDFTLNSPCAGSLALPPIPVGATGAFVFVGNPTGSPAATAVRITGRFVSSREARGTTQVSQGGCRDATTTFVARLS